MEKLISMIISLLTTKFSSVVHSRKASEGVNMWERVMQRFKIGSIYFEQKSQSPKMSLAFAHVDILTHLQQTNYKIFLALGEMSNNEQILHFTTMFSTEFESM